MIKKEKIEVVYQQGLIYVNSDIGIAYFSEYSDDLSEESKNQMVQKVKNGILHCKINHRGNKY